MISSQMWVSMKRSKYRRMAGIAAANMAHTGRGCSAVPVAGITQPLSVLSVTAMPSGTFNFSVKVSPALQSTRTMITMAMGTQKPQEVGNEEGSKHEDHRHKSRVGLRRWFGFQN